MPEGDLQCRLADGRLVRATRKGATEQWDVALLSWTRRGWNRRSSPIPARWGSGR